MTMTNTKPKSARRSSCYWNVLLNLFLSPGSWILRRGYVIDGLQKKAFNHTYEVCSLILSSIIGRLPWETCHHVISMVHLVHYVKLSNRVPNITPLNVLLALSPGKSLQQDLCWNFVMRQRASCSADSLAGLMLWGRTAMLVTSSLRIKTLYSFRYVTTHSLWPI